MPAGLYFPKTAAFIRWGPAFHAWGAPYEISLDLEILGDIGIIGGLDKPISRDAFKEVVAAVRAHQLRPAKRRAKRNFQIEFL